MAGTLAYYQVDAFADRPFAGNAAAVCLVESDLPETVMQQLAAEINLAITCFVKRGDDGFSLRWFTPSVEIRLCGHGTLATAHILYEQKLVETSQELVFFTKSGPLTVTCEEGWNRIVFPRFSFKEVVLPEGLPGALGISAVQALQASDGRYILVVGTETQLRAMQPDFARLKQFESVAVTCRAEPGSPYDFLSRSFAPSHGVNEDAVTGSSHCALAPYWSGVLHKKDLFAYQASARGGELKLSVNDDRILIAGKAVTVIQGVISLD